MTNGIPCGIEELGPTSCWVQMAHARKYLQVGLRKQPRYIFRVVDRDGAVSIAVPQADRTLDGAVVQSGWRAHESPVLDYPVCPASGGFGEEIAGRLTNAGFAVQRAIHRSKIVIELT